MIDGLLRQLAAGQSLDPTQVAQAVAVLTSETVAPESKADFLVALAAKGESPAEIAAFVDALRERAIAVPVPAAVRAGVLLDVCGTGGDRLNTFNISTATALVVAAAGVAVAKHGNRAITSNAGSADVLEALGIPIDLAPEQAAEALEKHRFAFFFAPRYHPAFKHIAAARKLCAERGQRTVFNFLGPLLNPARPSAQLLGVPRPELCAPIAQVLQQIGVRQGMVVCGRIPSARSGARAASTDLALDEWSTLGPTTVAEFYQSRGFSTSEVEPAFLPLQPATLDDLAGGNAAHNASLIRGILAGTDRGPRRDAVLLNAAAALLVAGAAPSIAEGWAAAGAVIDSGRAAAKLTELARAAGPVLP